MELNLIKTTLTDLPSNARCILALKNTPFFFIRFHGNLYMNKATKGIRKVTAAVMTMWKYDYMENQDIMDEVDAAFDIVREAAGKRAADQLWKAWREAAQESREKRATEQAKAWITTKLETLSDEDWDEIYVAGFDSMLVDHGFWRAYSDLHDENRDCPSYRDWSGNARRAAFVYGYFLGKAGATGNVPLLHNSN